MLRELSLKYIYIYKDHKKSLFLFFKKSLSRKRHVIKRKTKLLEMLTWN